jgi:putative ABC transport system permease protein
MNSLVFSNMLHRPARTIVSIIGIGIGILLIVFTVGLANGTMRERAEREQNVGAEIMFRAPGSLGLSGSDAVRLPVEMRSEVEGVQGVAMAVPIVQNSVATKDGLTGSRLLEGIPFDDYAAISGLQIVQGRAFEPGKDEMITDLAWIERRKMKIGDKFSIYERDFTIVGSFEPSAGARIKIPLSTMQAQLGAEGKASAFLIKVAPGSEPDSAAQNLQNAFPDNQIIMTSELEELYMQGFPALGVFLDVVIGVAAAISGLIILLTMYTTVTERTRQIGVLKSLGMSNFRIAFIVVQEALLISAGGVVVGIAATYVLKAALAKWSTLTVVVEPETVVTIVIVGLLSGALGALYPGLRAARLDAVEALNYD